MSKVAFAVGTLKVLTSLIILFSGKLKIQVAVFSVELTINLKRVILLGPFFIQMDRCLYSSILILIKEELLLIRIMS
jgi:hypothetical protein